MTTTVDHPTRDELTEAITHLAASSARLPAHWVDRKATLHERINELLDILDLL